MKYLTQNSMELDSVILSMLNLGVTNSAFKRVVPASVMKDLREQYNEYLLNLESEQISTEYRNDEYWPVSTQVIKVNIAPLREAGYCYCLDDLTATCEALLREQTVNTVQDSEHEMNNLMKSNKTIGAETAHSEVSNDNETAASKSADASSEVSELDKALKSKRGKVYPAKMGKSESPSKKIISDKSEKSHQVRARKRKYFTKYMSNEFSKDVRPVSMNEMDIKTQILFKDRDFNELVSEITGMN